MTDSMSDEEIRENLLKLGMNIGPVVDSTRAFYRRKLAKLLGEIEDEPVSHSSNEEGSASENERHGEEVEQVKEDLFSQLYRPPIQIRGRRSTSSTTKRCPQFHLSREFLYHVADDLSTLEFIHKLFFLTFVIGVAVILYLYSFNDLW